jgi:hypothetical protein
VPQRVKGQEVAILITRGGVLENTLVDIHNFNWEFNSEVKIQGYLGEKNDRTDDVYHHTKFDYEMHTHTQDWLRFVVAVHDRQKRNTPNLVINISAVLEYPGGDQPVLFLPDCKFGPIAIANPQRADYTNKKWQGACDDYDLQFS